MEIVIHGHQTDVTDSLRLRAKEGARKLADHLKRAVNADICFETEGVKKTVEIVLHAPGTHLVAKADGKYHEPALTEAISKMDAQIRRLKSAKKKKVHGIELRA
jgi:ribosomal subunit interface protein